MARRKERDNTMTYEIANEVTVVTITDDLDEALDIVAELQDPSWINVFDEHDKYLYTIDAE